MLVSQPTVSQWLAEAAEQRPDLVGEGPVLTESAQGKTYWTGPRAARPSYKEQHAPWGRQDVATMAVRAAPRKLRNEPYAPLESSLDRAALTALLEDVDEAVTALLAIVRAAGAGEAPEGAAEDWDEDEPDEAVNERARKVAAVPQDVFDAYLASTPAPSAEGLLALAGPGDKRDKEPDEEPPAWFF